MSAEQTQSETTYAIAEKGEDRITDLKALFQKHGITFSDCVHAFGEEDSDNPYVALARSIHSNEGRVEIDDCAVVSESDEGAYVMGWLWVAHESDGSD